jgi:hypothetical protein
MTTIRGASEFIQSAELTSPASSFIARCWGALQEKRRRRGLWTTLYGLADPRPQGRWHYTERDRVPRVERHMSVSTRGGHRQGSLTDGAAVILR